MTEIPDDREPSLYAHHCWRYIVETHTIVDDVFVEIYDEHGVCLSCRHDAFEA